MEKLKSLLKEPDDKVRPYEYLLYGMGFIEDILESSPEKYRITNRTRLGHFQKYSYKLSHNLLYRYGMFNYSVDAEIWQVLEEEGIRDFENCAKCHKSANKEDAEKGEGGSEHKSDEKDND